MANFSLDKHILFGLYIIGAICRCGIMKKLIFIGPINYGKVATGGATRKNQLFIERFSELFDEVIAVDTLNWKKRPWLFFRLCQVLLFNRDAKVVISASSTYLLSFLYYTKLNSNLYFWVVGGNLQDGIRKGVYNLKALAAMRYILVQGKSMEKDLNSMGLNNVLYVANSKPIIYTPTIKPKKDGEAFRFVFLSRIHSYKGVQYIFEAVKILSELKLQASFTVDFYGPIEPDFSSDFQELVKVTPVVQYQGFLDLTCPAGYQILSSYDVMLFPTYFEGEGFPGVVLDAHMAGLPVIATDWNLNKEVIKEGQTGCLIPIHDSRALADAILKFINSDIDLIQMKRQCVALVRQYDTRNVLSEQLLHNIGLI